MALTDEQCQDLQDKVKGWSTLSEGERRKVGGTTYEIVNSSQNSYNGVTQAIAVAPVKDDGSVDYSETTIAVAGTQFGVETTLLPDGSSAIIPNGSTRNAISATKGMTPQYDDISDFYNQTERKLEKYDGKITTASGYSQSGPAVAKVAAQHGDSVEKVTNFADWGASPAYEHGDISKDEKKWLDEHATIYVDSDKDLIWVSGGKGEIPYGKKVVVEGKHDLNPFGDHNKDYPHIKGNGPDIDWYIKNGEYCSGMTRDQAKKAAKNRAKNEAKKIHGARTSEAEKKVLEKKYYDENLKDLEKNYEKEYGPYANEKGGKSKQTSSLLDSWELHALGTKVGGLATLLGAAGGGQQIFLKTEMLVALASQAMVQFAGFEAKLLAELEEAKEEVRRQCEEAKQRCLQAGPHLSSGEIEALMAPIQFEHVWDSGAEADIRAMLQSLKSQMTEISTHLVTSAERFSASDNTAAVQFM